MGGNLVMEATCAHVGVYVRDIQNYKRQRRVRRWVSLAYSEGATPTLTLTSHPGEEPDGSPIQLDQYPVGVEHVDAPHLPTSVQE